MLQNKIEGIGYSLSKGLILKDVLAPFRQLLNYPDTLASELEVSAAYIPILLMVFRVFFGDLGRVLV
jgi:hypothetical protein